MDFFVFLKENAPKGDLFVFLKENAPKGEVFDYLKEYIPNGDKFKKAIVTHTGLSPPVLFATVAVAAAVSVATVTAISSIIMPRPQNGDVDTEVATDEEEMKKEKDCCIGTNGVLPVESEAQN